MPRLLDQEIPRVWVRVSLLALIGTFCLLMGISIAWIRHLSRDLPSPAVIQEIAPSLKTLVLSARGDTIHEFYRENRAVVALPRIPLRLQQAVVAIEDRRFYDHYGVDARRIVKIIWVNLTSRSRPGASTLTQQLARNLFLTPEKTVSRKLKEIILALQIEQTYTKDEILAMYLNQIYLGRGAYGVQAAARTYFGKDVRDLADPELTLVAGLIQNPGRFNPFTHADAAYRRRAIVLQSMVETGSLTRERAEEIGRTQVRLADPDDVLNHVDFGGYFFEEVRQHLERRYGIAALYEGGLRVTTTLDPAAQRFMEQAVERHLTRFEKDFGYRHSRARYLRQIEAEEAGARPVYLQCAALLLDSQTGAVLGMVGGRSFRESKFNRAVQARRQPGSVFKPFVYLAAIERGYTPASILMDTPVVIDTGAGLWRPQNYSGKFAGPVTLRYALSHSINCPTARFYLDFGLGPVLDAARELGIASDLPRVPSVFLGAGEVSLIEVVAAYAAFGDQGIHAEPYLISRVETAQGEVLEENGPHLREALDPATAYIMADLLQSTLREGTGARAGQYGFSGIGAGKTGTTNDCTDAWFVGFTPRLCAGVWVGFDDKVTMGRKKTGAVMALPVWADFMGKIVGSDADEPFPRPAGITERPVCRDTGLLATTRCPQTRLEVFLERSTPGSPCSRHPGPLLDASRVRETPPPPAADEAPEDPEAHDLPDPPGRDAP
jgi:penicillin-binding protein 1A